MTDTQTTYMNAIRNTRRLSAEEEKTATLEDLVLSHQPLVASIAAEWARKLRNPDSFMEHVQNGNIGLLEAARRFDRSSQNRFSSYAVHWIRKEIYHASLHSERIMSVPPQAMKLHRKAKQLMQAGMTQKEALTEIKDMSEAAFKAVDGYSATNEFDAETTDDNTLLHVLAKAERALTPAERFAMARIIEGYDRKEVGEMIGFSATYVNNLYFSGIEKLQNPG